MQRIETIQTQIPFDFKEAKASNILISGTNRTGKTRLACGICSLVQSANWKVIAFDNSGVWKSISDIPIYTEIQPSDYLYKIPILDTSTIYDISMLIPERQKALVDFVLRDLWETRGNYNSEWVLVTLEEFELYGRSTRGTQAQNLFRIMHAGRNKQVRVLAITTDLALVDSAFIRLCQQRYHARLPIEENAKRKFRAYYGKDYTELAIHLETGKFLYLNKDNLRLVQVPLFKSQRRPQPYIEPQPERKGFWARIFG